MNLFGLISENSDSRLRAQVETEISKWLMDSDFESDARVLRRLSDFGIRGDPVLVSLAQIKSLQKYKYALNPQNLNHILDLARSQPILQKLIQDRPYLLAKSGMIYEHAPTFLFGGDASPQELDACLLTFASDYMSKFWEYSAFPEGAPLTSPHPVLAAAFWDKALWHPVAYLKKAYQDNLLGVEYYIDFHPFNLNKLLPEDFSTAHRDMIREWVEGMNIQFSIHSAIVGPYSSPNPYLGKQLYYAPVDAIDLQKETVIFARDTAASSVVLHLIAPERLSELAEIIETASDSDVRVTLENYYYTEKINQTSEQFIAVLESLIPLLTQRTRTQNFGVTFDPGHYNIEGEYPIIAALNVSRWCLEKGIHLTKVHATTNYGPLHSFPPNFSSDVHDPVSNLGIHNRLVIQMIRSIGHRPLVTAEQIKPLIDKDIALIESAHHPPPVHGGAEGFSILPPAGGGGAPVYDYESTIQRGKDLLVGRTDSPITAADTQVEAYQFIAGLSGVRVLQEYLVYRRIQSTEDMTSETAKATTLSLMKASVEDQRRAIANLNEMLKTAIEAEGGVSESSIGFICKRLSGALFAEIYRGYLNDIFAESVEYRAGETICREGTIGDEMFYIKNGQAHVLGGDVQLATLQTGEIFGEMGLFYGIPRSATVKAATDGTEIGILKRHSLFPLIFERKNQAKAILYRLYSILPERLRQLNARYTYALETLHTLTHLSPFPSPLGEGREGRGEGQGSLPEVVPVKNGHIEDLPEPNFLFDIMAQRELEKLFNTDRFYAPGEIVFHEADRADGAYLVKSGHVRVVRHHGQHQDFNIPSLSAEPPPLHRGASSLQSKDSHEETLLATLASGSIIGEMALIDDAERAATIVSEGATLGYLSKETFDQIMEQDVELSHKLLLTLCGTMLARISRLNQSYLHVESEIRRYSQ